MVPQRNNRRPFKKEREHRINREIDVAEVRLVGENLEPGVYSIDRALSICQDLEVDLVEISPQAVPPVCRAVDYNKFMYEKKRKEKEQKAKSQKSEVKEIRFTPNTLISPPIPMRGWSMRVAM